MAMLKSATQLDREQRETQTVSKAVVRAAAALGLTNRALAGIVGLSEASVSRLTRGEFLLDRHGKSFELAVMLIRLYRSLDAVTGGDAAVASAWLKGENTALHAVPLDLIQTVEGLVSTVLYLDARRAVL
ncbi:MbcA/ParS/Xre antitoxin family protein [Methylobacterium indicum]|uniref:Transcriptional regulator, XRE family protein n=1 Tax=Methylobacterium indicum TaxID=1775910 RepID=A0ABR5HD63_9HYPH|nr:MbcA/ParS/Xre antitoxin family protein [Methylobacterium indicum]KMO23371.1 transcriptional regulator, XRE family protein [Methylobacterium indicum]KMO23868.1 transcriptional regulator, XRE family protein [Methylobacterium indicum]